MSSQHLTQQEWDSGWRQLTLKNLEALVQIRLTEDELEAAATAMSNWINDSVAKAMIREAKNE